MQYVLRKWTPREKYVKGAVINYQGGGPVLFQRRAHKISPSQLNSQKLLPLPPPPRPNMRA